MRYFRSISAHFVCNIAEAIIGTPICKHSIGRCILTCLEVTIAFSTSSNVVLPNKLYVYCVYVAAIVIYIRELNCLVPCYFVKSHVSRMTFLYFIYKILIWWIWFWTTIFGILSWHNLFNCLFHQQYQLSMYLK